jgi:hypothetical protein
MNLRQLMRLPINDLLMAVVICGNRATHMCPSAMRLQAASAFIACDSATYVYFVKHSVFSFVHTHFIETLAKAPCTQPCCCLSDSIHMWLIHFY